MERSKLLTQLSLKNGLIIAIVFVVISLAMHLIDPMMAYTNYWISFVLLIVFVSLLVYAGSTIRKEAGGYWTFGEAFKSFLVMSLIICLISTLYNVLLMGVIDPGLPERAGAAIDEKTSEFMLSMGMTEDQVEQEIAKASGADRLRVTVKNTITSFGVMLAIYGVLSLILAAILKKQPPVFLQTED